MDKKTKTIYDTKIVLNRYKNMLPKYVECCLANNKNKHYNEFVLFLKEHFFYSRFDLKMFKKK